MKVYIGPYTNYIGPYQIAKFFTKNEDWQDNIVHILDTLYISKFLEWIDSLKRRDIRVKIHDYDVWNMDSTLAYIVLPMLKMVKEQKQGVPATDEDDAPHIDVSGEDEENKMWNDKRWDYILDEMIWSFEQINSDWEDQYHKNTSEFPVVDGKIDWPNSTDFDYEGWKKHKERMENGFRLFGKYFQSLWT